MRRLTIEDCYNLANRKGGICISKEYIASKTKGISLEKAKENLIFQQVRDDLKISLIKKHNGDVKYFFKI